MKRKNTVQFISSFILFFICVICQAQDDSLKTKGGFFEVQSGFVGNASVPLWMRSNQYGSIPEKGASASFLGHFFKDYQKLEEIKDKQVFSIWDWGYSVEGRANFGKKVEGQLIEAYVKGRFAMFEAKMGRSKDVMGLNGDSLLTSGNFAVSGNALGIPKLEFSIPEYYRLPWMDGLFSVKGNFVMGYMGEMEMNPSAFRVQTSNHVVETFMHQKSLYGRLGKKSWNLELYAGVNHQVQWGGEKKRYGDDYKLDFFQTFGHVVFGQAYGGKGNPIPRSKVGNQQGSIDVGASYDFGKIRLMAYRQNFYDVGAISKLANIADGLNGLTIQNNLYSNSLKTWDWNKILLEFFYSKNQAGYPWSKRTKSGDEDYYNNSEYVEGWSYKGEGIGTPLIATANSTRDGLAHFPKDFFISNRVLAMHIGISGKAFQWTYISKITFAKHYGTFATSEFGKSTGNNFHTAYEEQFAPIHQFSFYLKAERPLLRKMRIGGTFAMDQGKLFYNSSGFSVSIRRVF